MYYERIIGLGVVALGLLLFFVIIPIGVVEPSNVSHLALAPQFWPKIISIMIGAMGVILVMRAKPGEPVSRQWLGRLPGLIVALGALFGFYFLIPPLGMVVPGMALIFGLMWYAGERNLIRSILIACAVPILLYCFFVYIANIPIPLGVFESLRG